MKTASIVFTIIGMVVNFLTGAWIFAIAGVVIGAFMLNSLNNNKKQLWLGILGIFFTGLLGGIFYLCWEPEKKGESENV